MNKECWEMVTAREHNELLAQRNELAALVREVLDAKNANTRAMKQASPSWVADARAALAKVQS